MEKKLTFSEPSDVAGLTTLLQGHPWLIQEVTEEHQKLCRPHLMIWQPERDWTETPAWTTPLIPGLQECELWNKTSAGHTSALTALCDGDRSAVSLHCQHCVVWQIGANCVDEFLKTHHTSGGWRWWDGGAERHGTVPLPQVNFSIRAVHNVCTADV